MKQNQKPCTKKKKVINRVTRNKTLTVNNISKNLQSFLQISLVQKEVLPLHKLRDHAYECQNPFGLKEDNLSQRNCQNQLSHPGLPHTEQECQEFDSRKYSQSKKIERRPQIFLKLSFRELCDSKLSGLYAFDNMAIID